MVNLRFERRHQLALVAGFVLLLLNIAVLSRSFLFLPLIVASIGLATLPHWLDVFTENRKQKELESRFPEFVRNLTGAIKSGMPASQAVIHVSDVDYGSLSPHIKKLANQLEWSIPFHTAFVNFGRETNNAVIRRAISTVIQAEQAGGNIEDVLGSITSSLVQIKRIREQRKSSIHSQTIQSYIIFFVFIGVMIIIQNLLIPYMAQFAGGSDLIGSSGTGIETRVEVDFSTPVTFLRTFTDWLLSLHGIFLLMAVIQGAFAGIVLGKLAEGDLTSGLKHSLFMGTAAFIVMSVSQSFAA